jgi:hypothetical protein
MSSLSIEPVLELRTPREVESGQQLAAIELEGLSGLARIQRILEGCGVAPELCRVETDLLLATALEQSLAQGAVQYVERLAQGVAGALLVRLGPEDWEKLISAVESAMRLDCQATDRTSWPSDVSRRSSAPRVRSSIIPPPQSCVPARRGGLSPEK